MSQKATAPVLVTTTERPAGYEVKQALGQVFGVVVRSRGLGGNVMAGLRALGGGEIVEYTRLVEDTRRHAVDRMIENASGSTAKRPDRTSGRFSAQGFRRAQVDLHTRFQRGDVDPLDVRVFAFPARAERDGRDAGSVGQRHVHPVRDADGLPISAQHLARSLGHGKRDRVVRAQL